MLFSSMTFMWIFLPAVIIINFLLSMIPDMRTRITAKNSFLLVASLAFYAWGGIYYLLIMLASITINYLCGRLLGKFSASRSKKQFILVLAIIANIGMLFFFKYFNMLVVIMESLMLLPQGLSAVFSTMIGMEGTGALGFAYIVLPIGISFFTFQSMSYVIDVYMGKASIQKNIINFALYVSLFPQLIAGPIVKYSDVALQLDSRKETIDLFLSGQKRFCYGLGKKVLLSNTLAVVADKVWGMELESIGTPLAWLGIVAYMLQIYYDFSGYSDMAIGIGRMLGFTFRENFNYPFTSFSVSEFWRRWHISLSSWFKEYIYIPLGGNRKGKGRTYFNLFIVFLLTGIWHGANFTYLLWGIYYAVLQIIEKLFLGKLLDKNPIKAINVIYNLLTATVGFTIFRAANIFDAGKYLSALFSFSSSGLASIEPLSMQAILALVFGILLCGIVQRPLRPAYEKIKTKLPVLCIDYTIQFTILIITILMLISGTYNPFIYFQF